MPNSRQIERIAAAWLARRDAGAWPAHEQARLDAWLSACTAHRIAFVRLEAAWHQSDRLKALGAGVASGTLPARGAWTLSPFFDSPEAHHLPATGAANDAVGETPCPQPATPASATNPIRPARRAPKRPWRTRLRYVAAAAAVILTASLALGWHHYTAVEQATYRSAMGGLQEVPLADGSVVTLSSDSRILVTFSLGERHVDLQQGEAFFKVAKDPARPFVVGADGRRATAVGTRFAVRRGGTDLRVVVTEGLVRLEADNNPDGRRQPTTLLPAGSVATASNAGVVVRSGSIQRAEEYLSWRTGFVNFHDTPLSAAAAEFNRYNPRKIVIGDAAVGRMRIGGNFRWSNADTFVRLLEQGFPIRAVRRDNAIVLQHR